MLERKLESCQIKDRVSDAPALDYAPLRKNKSWKRPINYAITCGALALGAVALEYVPEIASKITDDIGLPHALSHYRSLVNGHLASFFNNFTSYFGF